MNTVLLTAPAAKVYIGKNMILNLVSGYCMHTYDNTAIIAPD